MKIITPVFLLSSFLLLSSQPVLSADTDKAMLDALSEEAKETSMDEGIIEKEATAEPSIVPKKEVSFSDLEGKIAAQIKGLLVDTTKSAEKGTTNDAQFQNKLENIVSSALLKGNKLDDIRNAVSAAMININEEGGEEEGSVSRKTVESATKALKSIVGENKVEADGNKDDAYIQSLQSELSANGTETKKTKTVKPTTPKELQPATIRDVVKTTPEKSKDEQVVVASSADTVTVLEGETLFKIAQRVYGSGANYLALYEANKGLIEDPNMIRIGQVLKVPR